MPRTSHFARAIALLLVLAAPARAGCPATHLQPLNLPATRAALAQGRDVTIVAFGSSSTEGVGASTPEHTYPARLQAILSEAWHPVRVRVLNRGVGGEDVVEMLARLDRDVLALEPTLVIWQNGANAALRHMDIERYAEHTHEGVERIAGRGIDLVLMDNQLAPRILAQPHAAEYSTVLAREAHRDNVSLFSRTALMEEWIASDPTTLPMLTRDQLHHTDRGYECLATALALSIEAAAHPPSRPRTRTQRN